MSDTRRFIERREDMKLGLPISAWVGFVTAALSIGISWGMLQTKLDAEIEARKTADSILERQYISEIQEVKAMVQDLYKVAMGSGISRSDKR
jgi:hypothetical protein